MRDVVEEKVPPVEDKVPPVEDKVPPVEEKVPPAVDIDVRIASRLIYPPHYCDVSKR